MFEFEEFSPQGAKVMQALADKNLVLDDAEWRNLEKLDWAHEVVYRNEVGQIALTRKAINFMDEICDEAKIAEFFREMIRGRGCDQRQKPTLRLVHSAEPEKAEKSDDQDSQSEQLPQGEKSE